VRAASKTASDMWLRRDRLGANRGARSGSEFLNSGMAVDGLIDAAPNQDELPGCGGACHIAWL
jgi:hypothetical protein